MLLDRTVKQRK